MKLKPGVAASSVTARESGGLFKRHVEPNHDFTPKVPVQAGVYVVAITFAEVRKRQKSDIRYIVWTLRILQAKYRRFIGRPIYHCTDIDGDFVIKLYQFLQAADENYTSGPFDIEDFIGKKLEVTTAVKPGAPMAHVTLCAPYVEKGEVMEIVSKIEPTK